MTKQSLDCPSSVRRWLQRHLPRIAVGVGGLLAFPACDDEADDGAAALQREDAQGIAEGDAQGSDATGLYTLTSFDVTRCTCREGADALDCSTVELAAEALAVEQDGGKLGAQAVVGGEVISEISFAGGVNADGSFVMGSVLDATDEAGDVIGATVQLVEGTIGSGELDARWSTRLTAVFGGQNVDCDVDYDVRGSVTD